MGEKALHIKSRLESPRVTREERPLAFWPGETLLTHMTLANGEAVRNMKRCGRPSPAPPGWGA